MKSRNISSDCISRNWTQVIVYILGATLFILESGGGVSTSSLPFDIELTKSSRLNSDIFESRSPSICHFRRGSSEIGDTSSRGIVSHVDNRLSMPSTSLIVPELAGTAIGIELETSPLFEWKVYVACLSPKYSSSVAYSGSDSS